MTKFACEYQGNLVPKQTIKIEVEEDTYLDVEKLRQSCYLFCLFLNELKLLARDRKLFTMKKIDSILISWSFKTTFLLHLHVAWYAHAAGAKCPLISSQCCCLGHDQALNILTPVSAA